jgi:diguanylate cyclase (GGDEF)-like protein/PAS domain S-box-containing protein
VWQADAAFLFLPVDALLLIDESSTISYADRAALALFDEPVGRAVAQVWPELAGELSMVPASNSSPQIREVAVGLNGAERRVRIFHPDSGIGAVVLAEEHLRTQPPGPAFDLFDRVLRDMKEPVLITTAQPITKPGPITVYVNDAFLRETGFQREEVLGRSPRILQGAATSGRELARIREALSAWQPSRVEVQNFTRSGVEFWVELDIGPVSDETGWFTHWVSVQRDVTERRLQERDREAREAVVQSILDSLPALTAMIDPSGRILAVNAAWHRAWLDHSRLGEPSWLHTNYLDVCRASAQYAKVDFDGSDYADEALRGIEAVLARDRPSFNLDYEIQIEGSVRWFHMQVVPLVDRQGAVVSHLDVTTRKGLEMELGHQATHDALTDLANRDLIARAIDEAAAAARRNRQQAAVVYADLDDFKDINDAFGHEYGDRILTTIADRLRALVGCRGTVARVGGDEFVILLPELEPGWHPDSIFRDLRNAVAQPINLGFTTVKISASAGVVTVPPHNGDSATILRDADAALYASKRSGRDRWTAFTDGIRRDALARLITNERIEQAIAQREFELHFQPIIDLDSGAVISSEALLRWRDPEQGLLLPGAFLAAIESGPMIEMVGDWILNEALSVQSRWQQVEGFADHVMSVNLSPRQMGRGHLPEVVAAALARHNVPPRCLSLEIIEESLVQTGSGAQAEVTAIHQTGVRFAVDDFGTGYSSVAYLLQFPISLLKIDREFLRSGPRGATTQLLRAVGQLAHAVGAASLVEGIETEADLAMAREAQIDACQGYLFGRPVPPGERPDSGLLR